MKLLIIILLATSSLYAQTTGVIATISQSQTTPVPPEPPDPTGTIYVDLSFVGTSNGSQAAPWKTIQDAANVAGPDDIVLIGKAGVTQVYRETPIPVNSGTSGHDVIYREIPGGVAIISGADPVNTTWTVHSGSIFRTPFTMPNATNFDEETDGTNTNILANQLFKDGEMMHLARYPNISTSENLLEKTTFRNVTQAVSWNASSLNDPTMPTGMTGAKLWINGWFLSETVTITGQSGNSVFYSGANSDSKFRRFWYITNKLALLDAEKEWHYESGILYFRQPGGGSPTGVTAKKRNYGFDLRSKSYIKIEGLEFFACDPIISNTASLSITVDGIKATYPNHSFMETNPGGGRYHVSAVQTGMKLLGSGSILKNSKFLYSAGVDVWAGYNTTIEGNYFYNSSYNGMYSGCIKPWFGTAQTLPAYGTGLGSFFGVSNDNITITGNTFERTGRGAVELTQDNSDPAANITIDHNDFSYSNMLNVDGAPIYSSRTLNHAGMKIIYNAFHDSGITTAAGGLDGIQVTGPFYWDQGAGPCVAAFNVAWNGYPATSCSACSADIYNQRDHNGNLTAGSYIYNNTLASVSTSQSYVTYTTTPNDIQRNNIYLRGIVTNWGASSGDISNSVRQGENPLFTNTGTGISRFQLQSSSPARGRGTATISGLPAGSPTPSTDAGALPFGTAPFSTGATQAVKDL